MKSGSYLAAGEEFAPPVVQTFNSLFGIVTEENWACAFMFQKCTLCSILFLLQLENTNHKQWFYFRASGALKGKEAKFGITNAGKCAYAFAFKGYTVCYSYDRSVWKRCTDTVYDSQKGTLEWKLMPQADVIFFAYFAPYSQERHLDLVSLCASSTETDVIVRSIGKTLDGRDIDLVTIGKGPLQAWVIHRQHPGESQAEWFAEGLLHRLLGAGQVSCHVLILFLSFGLSVVTGEELPGA